VSLTGGFQYFKKSRLSIHYYFLIIYIK